MPLLSPRPPPLSSYINKAVGETRVVPGGGGGEVYNPGLLRQGQPMALLQMMTLLQLTPHPSRGYPGTAGGPGSDKDSTRVKHHDE